ncbi:hypothetical protein ACR3LQ_00290 [Kosakonia cowanii]|uniref:hypothetical protein n=1 Tax=Kosakonia cowanii TaxID=208223 RepID=UPI003EE47A1B
MQDTVAEGLAAAASHPVTVQVINQGPGISGNVATGLITAGAAIVAVILTHRYTHWREKQAAVQKLKQERLFIATELIFLLEEFAVRCATIATDGAFENRYSLSGADVGLPEIDLSEVKGDWRVLPARLMYRIRELPITKQSSDRTITTGGYRAPPYFEDTTTTRRYEYTRLGIRAIVLARSLRSLAGFIQTRSEDAIWPAKKALIKAWRQEKKRRRTLEMVFEQGKATAYLKSISREATDNSHGNGDSA